MPCPMEAWLIEPPRGSLKRLQVNREIGWNQPQVAIGFGSCEAVELHSPLTAIEAQEAVRRAVDSWNRALTEIQFHWVSDLAHADVIVQWFFAHEDPDRHLTPNVQAHADYPLDNSLFGHPHPMHFNADFLWGIETDGCFDVETIALHELGHLLGLIYHSGIGSIMYGSLGPAPIYVQHALDTDTIQRARWLYR